MESSLAQLGISSAMTKDIPFFVLFLFIGGVLGFFFRRSRSVSFLYAMYISFLLLQLIPDNTLPPTDYVRAALFVIVTTLLALLNPCGASGCDSAWKWIFVSVCNVSCFTAFLFALLPQYIPLEYISYTTYSLFNGGWALFGWAIAPLIFLLLVNRLR